MIVAILLIPVFMWLVNAHYHKHNKYNLLQEANGVLVKNGLERANASLEYMDASLSGVVASFAEREEAQKLVDDIHGIRVRPEDNKIEVAGWLQMQKRSDGTFTSDGLLPEELSDHVLLESLSGDDNNIEFKKNVTNPKALTQVDDNEFGELVFGPTGKRTLELREDDIVISGDSTLNQQAAWQEYADENLSDVDLEFNTDIYASQYHMPGYKYQSSIDEAAANDLAARLKEQTIYFDSDSPDISETETDKVLELVEIINGADERVGFVAGGHADATGSAAQNMRLGKARAQALYDELKGYGADISRIEIVSFGATQVIGQSDSEESKRLSRRVEVLIK